MKKNVFNSFLPALFLLMFMTGIFTSCPQPETPAATYTITISSIIGGTVTASATTAAAGTEVQLIALEAAGYKLEKYIVVGVNGNVSVAGNKFIMPASNVIVSATFTLLPIIVVSNCINGTVTASPSSYVEPGTEVTLSNTPDDGYGLDSYTVMKASGGTVTVTDDKFIMPAENVVVTATFTAINYTISIGSINNGTVTSNKTTATVGTEVTLSNTPESGYAFGSYTVTKADGGTVQVTNNKFTMPAESVTVTARFMMPYALHSAVTVLPAGTDGTAGTGGTYVYFGDWPQTIKASGVTVYEDNDHKKVMGGNTYYLGSDSYWYAKCRENAYNPDYKYSDNTTVATSSENSYKWFKVEPIKWRVLTNSYNNTGKKLLLAESILTANIPYYPYYEVNRTIDSATISPNNYKESAIRAYLNGLSYTMKSSDSAEQTTDNTYNGTGFLQDAFTASAQNLIATTAVDNSATSTNPASNATQWNNGNNQYACADTYDKIFLLSEKEVTTEAYGFASSYSTIGTSSGRIRMMTDYAKANHVFQDTTSVDSGSWWLRSPDWNYDFSARCVDYDGYVNRYYHLVHFDDYAVVPALCIEF